MPLVLSSEGKHRVEWGIPAASVLLVPLAFVALALLAPPAHADPIFSVERGLYDAPFTLELTPSQEGATIWYGLGGRDANTAYAGPLSIDGTRIVRAREVAADGTSSRTVTHSYLFVTSTLAEPTLDRGIVDDPGYGPMIADTLVSIPTISLAGPTGLSVTETPFSFEWIDPADPDPGDPENQVDCGSRLVGGHSIVYEKNSIRLAFRGRYGASRLHLDLYGDDATGVQPATAFDALTLRGGNHDSVFYLGAQGQYLRNLWMDETQLDMGHLAPHGRFAHLYIDGAYRGLYHVRERFNAAFLAEYLDGEEEEFEAINGGTAFDGTGAAWAQVVASSHSYARVQPWLDVRNFLDYMVLNFYAGNAWDWSYNHNWIAAGPNEPGKGGFKFQSSDSDICLYYDYTVNILNNPGPSSVFGSLLAEGDPEFQIALADAIHRNLRDAGPLAADVAGARYTRLAALAEDPVVAESARWGGGWWDRDDEWVTERARLLNDWFPLRTGEMKRQFRAAGWYPLDGPEFSLAPGVYPPGTTVAVTTPDLSAAELWLTTDGTDPRVEGGAVSPSATGPDALQEVSLVHSVRIHARQRNGATWGPLAEGYFEVDETPPVVLNEWNSVKVDKLLDEEGYPGSGSDSALGRVEGNGGDWIELLVMAEEVDLRGWRLTLEDRRGACGDLTFTDEPLLAHLRAGTILTIAEDLPEDAAYDPEGGDWRFHLRAAAGATGRYVTAADFDVTQLDWRLTLRDPSGAVRFGPAGETVAPTRGLSSTEVGLLAADPSPALRRDANDYIAGTRSTFGAANEWDGGVQDLTSLRGEAPGGIVDTPDTGQVDPPAPDKDGAPAGCGCSVGSSTPGASSVVLAWLATRRRRALLAALTGGLVGCSPPLQGADPDTADLDAPASDGPCFADDDLDGYGDPATPTGDCAGAATADSTDCDDADAAVSPAALEVCDGLDNNCDGAIDDPAHVVDPLPFYADRDGDGYGDDSDLFLACAAGGNAALAPGDCDDADPAIHPGAEEICDDVDQDCDGSAVDALGGSADCPASSCLEVLADGGAAPDGPRWLRLPNGETAPVWCDMAGGGWTLGFLRNTAATGSQGDFGAGYENLGDLAVSPVEASASATPRMGWLDLNDLPWTDLRLTDVYNRAVTWTTGDVPRAALRIPFGEDGYYLYGGETGYYWCGGDRTYTDQGKGAVNNPEGAPAGCKGHGSLGSGWDFSASTSGNQGMTLCGGDGTAALTATWGGTWVYYGAPGGAQAIWVR